MAKDEQRYGYQPKQEPLRIEDLPESPPDAQQENVKGGMVNRGGIIGASDPDSGDEIDIGF